MRQLYRQRGTICIRVVFNRFERGVQVRCLLIPYISQFKIQFLNYISESNKVKFDNAPRNEASVGRSARTLPNYQTTEPTV